MRKNIREIVKMAQLAGLQFVEEDCSARHHFLKFRNSDGVVMLHPVSLGGAPNSGPDIHNMRGQFKRFARGQTHGLKVIA